MTTRQIAVRIPEELLAKLDELVRSGAYESRADAVRAGLETIARIDERRSIDRSILEGYRQHPPTPAEDAAASSSLRDAIEEESW
ncbi:MAG: ribbon-helix-helix protein, CopG family [Actinomycetota bacterium]|nr:ribbon-helix-helix protein, CopG family [Actinomycetota bacterium]